MKKVLVLIQIFETPDDNGSDRHFYFCKKLVEEGYDVNVITSNIDYKSAVPRFNDQNSAIKEIYGITVEYLKVYTNIRGSFIRRIFFYLSFFFQALYVLPKKKDIDIIYAVSTPLSTGLLGSLASWFLQKPLTFEVTDVWPDAAIHTGVIKNRLLILLLKLIENICYSRSDKIIALTEGIKRNIENKIQLSGKIELIPNGVDISLFEEISLQSRSNIRESYDFGSKIVCTYLGAHGSYNSLQTLIEAANYLKTYSKFIFLFIGDGDEKIRLIQLKEELGLENVKFVDPLPRKQAINMLNASDLFLLPNRKGKFFEGNLPNKLFDFMMVGRPIIISGRGESSKVIQESGCGISVEPEDYIDMANNIIELGNMTEYERFKIGKKGSDFVRKNYNREEHSKLLEHIFANL